MKMRRLVTLCLVCGFVFILGIILRRAIESKVVAFSSLGANWTFTGNLNGVHVGHVATKLQNGKVLVAGGRPSANVAELYDPGTQTWSATAPMINPHALPTATLLPDGRVLVTGGTDGVSDASPGTANCEIYDPVQGTWTATANLNTARYFHQAVLLPNGKVLVAGGFDNNFVGQATAELFDPATETWSYTGSMNQTRRDFSSTLLTNGKVLVAAGSGSFSFLSSAELYDPATGAWTYTGNLGFSRQTHTSTLLPDGRVLVTGGTADFSFAPLNIAQVYDPTTGVWSSVGNLNFAHTQHTATLLTNGQVLVAGGYPNYTIAELFDSTTGTWTQTASLLAGTAFGTATGLDDGKVLVANGNNGQLFDLNLPPPTPTPTATPTPSCVPPPSGMVGWWPGDGNANDILGTNNGTPQNGATFTSGKVGQGFNLDGVDDYVEIPDSASLKITGAITIDAWVKPDIVTGNYPGRGIVSRYDGVTGQASYLLWITPTGELVFSVYELVGSLYYARYLIAPNTLITPGVFTHIAATFDPATQDIKIYLNGVDTMLPLGPGSATITSIFDSTAPVRIGAFFEGGGPSGFNGFFDGIIDEVEIFNRALAAAEIAAIYNAGSAGKCRVANTATIVVSDHDPSTFGDSVTFTATVSAGGAVTSGSVTFKEGGTTLAGPLVLDGNGQASFISSSLNAGSHTITADYDGAANFNASSGSVVQTVNAANQTIDFAALSSKTYGDPSFAIGATASSSLPVIFSIFLGPATISGNTITITGAGPVVVRASQSGNADFNPAADVDQSFMVNRATPIINWGNPADIVFGTALDATQLNATANVPGTFVYTPTAGVQLNYGPAQSLSLLFTPGDTVNYNNANANVLINVGKASTATGLTSSVNPTVTSQATTFTATVVSGSGAPSGSVEFKNGATSLGVVALSGGVAALNTSTLGGGAHAITATYNGAANFLPSTSLPLSQIVSATTPPGSNVPVQTTVGSTTITTTIANVTTGGTTTVTPINPSSAGTLPGGFNLSGSSLAFEITTTSTFKGSANVCFQVPSITDPVQFASLRVLHSVPKLDLAFARFGSNDAGILLGNGSGSFGGATGFPAATRPYAIAVGDFNGDGKQDLVTANNGSNNTSILIGNGAGGFGATTNLPAGTAPRAVAIGDFNGDGKQDFVVANYGSNNISIRLGNGAGGFGAVSNLATGTNPHGLAVGDFNADGKQDLAITNNGSNNVSIRLGNGTGGFGAATNLATGNNPAGVAVGDFNGDSKQDLVTANFSSTVSILLGNGAGGFGAATNVSTLYQPFAVAVGDFNADGKQDLVVGKAGANRATVLRGNGLGGFGSPLEIQTGNAAVSVAVADFNSDNRPDLAVAGYFTNNVTILLGNSGGTFTSASFAVGTNPYSVAVGNFNGDVSVVDQTILSGPNAPNFATKTICANVLSFSPFVLAQANDTTPPIVAASLTPVGTVSKIIGQFRVGFGATDTFDASPTASAVMETPLGTDSFAITFVKVNVDEAAITFDFDRRRITLIGRDEGIMRGLLATLRSNGGAAVSQNQVLLMNPWPVQQYSYVFRNGVLLAESAPILRLRVTAIDAARNVGIATATPTFAP